MLAAAAIWAFTAGMAYWSHMKVKPPSETTTSWVRPSTLNAQKTVLASGIHTRVRGPEAS